LINVLSPNSLVALKCSAGGRPARDAVVAERRIVLVDFPWTRDKDPRVALGHASLLAALRSLPGVDVRSVVLPVNAPGTSVETAVHAVLSNVASVAAEQVDVAIGVYVWSEDLVQVTLPRLRRAGFRGRIVLGGPQISYAGGGLEGLYPDADAFVRGYGEGALRELARIPGRPRIAGVHYAGDADLAEQATVALEALPSPWLGAHAEELGAFVRWETQRGCPFRCSFCQHREAGARLRRRALASERIDREIEHFVAAGVRDIAVLDPIFNLSPVAVPILERFSEVGYMGRLSLQCRAEFLDDVFLDAAARLDVQLELGLQTIHAAEARAVRRTNNLGKIDAALSGVRRRGIAHEVSLIFGLPCQTMPSFTETVRWCLERRVPVIKAFPLMLLRGTELESDRARWGLVDSGGSMPMVVASDSFTRDGWLAMARMSEALRLTEGSHPQTIDVLHRVAEGLRPDRVRWMPAEMEA